MICLYFYYLTLSIVLFVMMGVDKGIAIWGQKKHIMRIPEKVLLCIGFFGGAIGGFAGMYLFHHKIRKGYFTLVFSLGVVVNCIFVFYLQKNFL